MDSEVARLLREAEQSAIELVRTHQSELGQLVTLLLEKETVDGEEVYRIFGRAMPVHRSADTLAIAPHRAWPPDRVPATGPAPAVTAQPATAPDPAAQPGAQAGAQGADGQR